MITGMCLFLQHAIRHQYQQVQLAQQQVQLYQVQLAQHSRGGRSMKGKRIRAAYGPLMASRGEGSDVGGGANAPPNIKNRTLGI